MLINCGKAVVSFPKIVIEIRFFKSQKMNIEIFEVIQEGAETTVKQKQNSRENFNKLGKRTNPLDKARNISCCAVV